MGKIRLHSNNRRIISLQLINNRSSDRFMKRKQTRLINLANDGDINTDRTKAISKKQFALRLVNKLIQQSSHQVNERRAVSKVDIIYEILGKKI